MAHAGETSVAAVVDYETFKKLSVSADRKFARARDAPAHARGAHVGICHHKALKAYKVLWELQQERRRELVAGGLRRWEVGEIASRIGQLYYGQYLRSGETRFLLAAYAFYDAILSRNYFVFSGGPEARRDRRELLVRYKEMRFLARFLVVALLLDREDLVNLLSDKLRKVIDDCKSAFPTTNFKEWKMVVQEIGRFLQANSLFKFARHLRYNVSLDSYPSSHELLVRFHSKRSLKLQDAVLTSYHRNEVKFAELTLDTYRMLQCLEWELSWSHQVPVKVTAENGTLSDQSAASGLIDVSFATDLSDPNHPINPRKSIIYHPSVPHLVAVVAAICEELPSDSALLIYISAAGTPEKDVPSSSSGKVMASWSHSKSDASDCNGDTGSTSYSSASSENYLWLGPQGSGLNKLYPEDLIPFTRSPLVLVVDGDNCHSFKAIHGAEKGEAAVLLLSPTRPSSISMEDSRITGSQFTYFLTAPLQAFCQLLGLSSELDPDACNGAEHILSSAFSEWESALCRSDDLDEAWVQLMLDPFLRRLILRFIFCRTVLFLVNPRGKDASHLPLCLPDLPESLSQNSEATKVHIKFLAEKLGVANHFQFRDSRRSGSHRSRRP